MAYYTVTVSPKIESWNCQEYTARFYATNRADAIKQARREYNDNCGWTNGAATYKASKDENQQDEEGESPFVYDGYNVEFQGARPAVAGNDY